MTGRRRTAAGALGALAAIGGVLAVIYLVVACESLPRWMGGVPGDPHPRTALGLVVLGCAIGLAASSIVTLRARRQ